MDLLNSIIDSGGLELILAATGMGAAIPGIVLYKRIRKAKKMKEQILG